MNITECYPHSSLLYFSHIIIIVFALIFQSHLSSMCFVLIHLNHFWFRRIHMYFQRSSVSSIMTNFFFVYHCRLSYTYHYNILFYFRLVPIIIAFHSHLSWPCLVSLSKIVFVQVHHNQISSHPSITHSLSYIGASFLPLLSLPYYRNRDLFSTQPSIYFLKNWFRTQDSRPTLQKNAQEWAEAIIRDIWWQFY